MSQATRIGFVASLAVAMVLQEQYRLSPSIKWPNDVLIGNRKICGILIDTRSSGRKVLFVIVGIGINVNVAMTDFPESIRLTSTSVQDERGRKVRISTLLEKVLLKLEMLYDLSTTGAFQPSLLKWKEFATFLGQEVTVIDHDASFRGTACDIDRDGQLVLRMEDGSLKRFVSGTVSMRIE